MMQYQKYDLGQCSPGQKIKVVLQGSAANVRLMNRNNFQSYRSGRTHNYVGGHYTQSPIYLTVPDYGEWYVAIDLGGYAGRVSSSVSKI